jgi:hypothetical protein
MNIFLIYPIGIKHRWNKDNIARGRKSYDRRGNEWGRERERFKKVKNRNLRK